MLSQELQEKGIPKKNLIFVSVGVIIFGLIATNVVINFLWQKFLINDLKKILINYQISEAKRIEEGIEKSIEKNLKDIENLSTNISFFGKENQKVEYLFSQFLKEHSSIKEISIINLYGREEKKYSEKDFSSQKIIQDFAFLKEFETAKNGNTYVSPINFTDYAEPCLIIYSPIRKLETDSPEAVLRVVFFLPEDFKEILETTIEKNALILIVGEKGTLIADSQNEKFSKNINPLNTPPAQSILKKEVFWGGKYYNDKNEEVLGTGIPIKNLKGGVIIEQNAKEFEKPLIIINRIIILFFISALIIVAILFWLLIIIIKTDNQLIERYTAWKNVQTEIAEAKEVLEIKVKARTKELETLAKNLEEKVKERTKELENKVAEMEKFQRLTVGRELAMIELKKEIKRLKEELENCKKNEEII